MLITLLIWTAVAADRYTTTYQWRELTTVQTPAACHLAAKNLGIGPKMYRCIAKDTGEMK